MEHHVNNPEIIIADTSPKQAVYIYGCKNSTVQVLQPPQASAAVCLQQKLAATAALPEADRGHRKGMHCLRSPRLVKRMVHH